jgi:hypothetical protein
MTREQRYAIIKMVKDYVKLGADINALKSLLASEQIARRVLPNWEADFRALQNSPPNISTFSQQTEDAIARLEQAISDDDLIAFLARNLPEGLPN